MTKVKLLSATTWLILQVMDKFTERDTNREPATLIAKTGRGRPPSKRSAPRRPERTPPPRTGSTRGQKPGHEKKVSTASRVMTRVARTVAQVQQEEAYIPKAKQTKKRAKDDRWSKDEKLKLVKALQQ